MMTEKTITTRFFALLLILVMGLVQMPVLSVSAAQSVTVQDFKELKKAISSYADAEDDIEILLSKDISVTKALSIEANSRGKALTIKSDGTMTYKITRGEGVIGDLFVIASGATVTYDNVTVEGKETKTSDTKKNAEVTKEPETAKEPEVTKEPETTKEPEVTKEPETTKEPEVTKEPETTKEPEVTKEPETTKDPQVTKEPEATKVLSEQEDPTPFKVGIPPDFEAADFQLGEGTTYDGTAKKVTVTPSDSIADEINKLVVKYDGKEEEPTKAGTYDITIDIEVKAGSSYNDVKGLLLGTFKIEKATLLAKNFVLSDYHVTYDGTSKDVAVKGPNDGIGEVTVKYNGNAAAPSAPGTYAITVDVAEGINYKAAADISLGNLVIEKITLTAKDFELQNNTVTYNGKARAASVKAADGITGSGKIGIKYNGSTTIPVSAGTYKVTIDVAEGTLYKAAKDLALGKLVIKPAKLTGTPEIEGTAKYAETLTADISDLNTDSDLSYQWYRDDKAISGATSSSYKIAVEDIGSKLMVIVTASGNYEGSVKSDKTDTVKKADGASVSNAPTVQATTTTQIQVNTVTNKSGNGQTVEYGISKSADTQPTTWQDSRVFSKLTSSTKYYVWARTKENATYYAGPAKVSAAIRTKTVTKTTTSTTKAVPRTGDETIAMIWITVALLSGVLGAGLIVRRRRIAGK